MTAPYEPSPRSASRSPGRAAHGYGATSGHWIGVRSCESCGWFEEGLCFAEPDEYPYEGCGERFEPIDDPDQ